MIKYDAKIVRDFFQGKLTGFGVNDVIIDDDNIEVCFKRIKRLDEYVNSHYFKILLFKSNGETYNLLRFYVNVGGEKGRIKKVYVLKNGDKIIDVIAEHEFKNAEKFANPNLTLSIDKIIAEDI